MGLIVHSPMSTSVGIVKTDCYLKIGDSIKTYKYRSETGDRMLNISYTIEVYLDKAARNNGKRYLDLIECTYICNLYDLQEDENKGLYVVLYEHEASKWIECEEDEDTS